MRKALKILVLFFVVLPLSLTCAQNNTSHAQSDTSGLSKLGQIAQDLTENGKKLSKIRSDLLAMDLGDVYMVTIFDKLEIIEITCECEGSRLLLDAREKDRLKTTPAMKEWLH